MHNKQKSIMIALGLLVILPWTSFAQSRDLSAFSVEKLAMQINFYLPPPVHNSQDQNNKASGTNQQPASPQPANQGNNDLNMPDRSQFYLTKAQADALLPILDGLKTNLYPSPKAAKALMDKVNAILTPAQQDAYQKFSKAREEQMRKQMQAAGIDYDKLQSMSPDERMAYIRSLPQETRQKLMSQFRGNGNGNGNFKNRQNNPNGGQNNQQGNNANHKRSNPATQDERRVRMLDNLLTRLKDWKDK